MPTSDTGVFKGYDLDDLRALVLRMLRVSNTSRFSPTSGSADYDWIDDGINRGQEEFVRLTRCLRSNAVIELINGHRTYRTPEDFIDLAVVYYYDSTLTNGYKELAIKTTDELDDEMPEWRTETGQPKYIYVDRQFGAGVIIGIAPIPEADGEVISYSSAYAAAVTWICPLYTYNRDQAVIIKVTGDDEWILPTQAGVSVDPPTGNKDLLLSYYRLPQRLIEQGDSGIQKNEIPREYQKAPAYYAAADLLSNNPADSAEYQRAQGLLAFFNREVMTYIDKRKRPFAGKNLRAKSHAWSWLESMDVWKDLK
jgi:hypothetical protein